MALVLLLAACAPGPDAQNGQALGMAAAIARLQEMYPPETARGQGIGGTLNLAKPQHSPFAGEFNPAFSLTADDGFITDFMFIDLLALNESNMFGQNGAARYEFDREAATFTLHFHDHVNMYWHDGVPVTMYDLLFAYELIAHPDLHSPRFGPALNTSTVLGIDEYREDPSQGISGIRVFNNGRSMELSFESLSPDMLFGGITTRPIPRHRFEGIPFAEIPGHPYTRTDIVGNGPFMWTGQFVDGESVILAANPNYWQGRPRLDYIHIFTLPPELVGEAMLSGEADLTWNFPTIFVPDYEDRFEGSVTLVSALDRLFTFMGFRFGTFNHDTQTVTPNPDMLINDIALRRALAYGRDDITVATHIFNDMRFPLATTIIPWSGDFMREDMPGFSIFDQDLANQILDEAGYEWRAGEAFRRLPNGEPFHLNWAIHENATNPLLAIHHMDDWAEIGLDVRLWQGGLMEFNDRIETLQFDTDNGQIHMFDAAWLKGSNPNPRALWGATTHNDTRWQHPQTDAILDRIESDAAWDTDYLMQAYADWQMAIFEHAPWIPVMTGIQLHAANNRLLNFSVARRDGTGEVSLGAVHLWDLSRDMPY